VSCVTDVVLDNRGGNYEADQPHAVTLGGGDPIPLDAERDLALRISLQYRIVPAESPRGPFKATITAYSYIVEEQAGAELLAYQWHPDARGARPWPHLHFRAAGQVGDPAWSKIHFPTGRVALEEVLRLLLDEMGVHPRREDWRERLQETQRKFEQFRTWPGNAQPPGAEASASP
jgi:hypothetical protein